MSKRNKFAPLPTPDAMLFRSAAQAYISCVTASNIAIGEGENSLLICESKHFCQGSAKNRYFCDVSQQVLSDLGCGFLMCIVPL